MAVFIAWLCLFCQGWTLLKVNCIIPEDDRFKFGVDPCAHNGDPLDQKTADRQTDHQTDGFSALCS